MDKIENLREDINEINEQLFHLFEKRLKKSVEIGKLKTKEGCDVYDPNREEEMLEELVDKGFDLPDEMVKSLMRSILEEMRKYSEEVNNRVD